MNTTLSLSGSINGSRPSAAQDVGRTTTDETVLERIQEKSTAGVHAAPLLERLSARIVRRNSDPGDECRTLCTFKVERFMGVLVHPVVATKVQDKIGIFRPAGKILVYWPKDVPEWYLAGPGDQLEVEGRTFTILGIDDYPFCYSEIYVDGQ